jgi:hypothetical protein
VKDIERADFFRHVFFGFAVSEPVKKTTPKLEYSLGGATRW